MLDDPGIFREATLILARHNPFNQRRPHFRQYSGVLRRIREIHHLVRVGRQII